MKSIYYEEKSITEKLKKENKIELSKIIQGSLHLYFPQNLWEREKKILFVMKILNFFLPS